MLAILAFVLGLVVGHQGSPPAEGGAAGAQPVAITGKVEYATKAGITTGDDQCMVFLLPTLKYPKTKISLAGLLPSDPRPDDNHPSIQRIRELGGDCSKTDIHGNFELKLLKDKKKKRFYLLAVAGYTLRKRDIPATDRAEIANFSPICCWDISLTDLVAGNSQQVKSFLFLAFEELQFKISMDVGF